MNMQIKMRYLEVIATTAGSLHPVVIMYLNSWANLPRHQRAWMDDEGGNEVRSEPYALLCRLITVLV